MFNGLNDDDDDAFFTPIPSSNLASLFGISVTQTNTLSANTSLTYTAPKQPTNKSEEFKQSSKSTLIVFKEVYAFKLQEKNYLNQGKCGLALIGNDTVQIYQILLYKQKNDIISSTKVTSHLQFLIQKDNYVSYCDDQKQNWTVHFNSDLDLTEFTSTLKSRGGEIKNSETGISELRSNLNSVVIKDKELPKQIDNDNNSDTSSSNVKANILSRMAKVGQKLLPNTSISDGTDSDTEREKLYNKNRKVKRGTSATISPILTATSSTDIAKKPANLSTNLQGTPYYQPVPQQYAIINGQTVPVISQLTSVPSETIPCNSVLPVENVPTPVMYTQVIPSNFDQFQMYFTENRTHNSEVRMNILRLTNKVEEVLEKVQKIDNAEKINTNNDKSLKEDNENLKLIITKLEDDIKINTEIYLKENTKSQERVQILVKENEELKNEIQNNLTITTALNKKIEVLELRIKEYEKMSTINTENDSDKELEKRNEKIKETVKQIMSSLYFEVNDQIEDEKTIQGEDVKRILAQKIKENTYSIISAVSELILSK